MTKNAYDDSNNQHIAPTETIVSKDNIAQSP